MCLVLGGAWSWGRALSGEVPGPGAGVPGPGGPWSRGHGLGWGWLVENSPPDHYCYGRYASYWNAFLSRNIFTTLHPSDTTNNYLHRNLLFVRDDRCSWTFLTLITQRQEFVRLPDSPCNRICNCNGVWNWPAPSYQEVFDAKKYTPIRMSPPPYIVQKQNLLDCVCWSSYFYQNEEILVHLDELDELDRITNAWIGLNYSLRQAHITF